jgi:putative transposase
MTEAIVDVARARIRRRGGNHVLKRHSATRQILDELTQITETPAQPKLRRQLIAARLRVAQSRTDHAEAQQAQDRVKPAPQAARRALSARQAWPNFLEDG